MPQIIAPELLEVARMVAHRFAGRAGLDREEAVGWAYLAVAELNAKRPLRSPDDCGLVATHVLHRLVDWQRRESMLTRGEISRRSIRRYQVPIEDAEHVAVAESPPPEPRLRDAIATLQTKEQEAIAAIYFNDLIAAEHARRTHYSEARISQFVQSALRKLRRFFGRA